MTADSVDGNGNAGRRHETGAWRVSPGTSIRNPAMRRLLLPAFALVLSASVAQAATTVDEAFGNTIVSTYPDGRTGELWLKADGSYSAEGRRHDMSSGHWTVKGEKLCLKQAKPIGAPFSFCTPIPGGGMGQAWSAKAVSGEAIQVRLVKGHHSGQG